MIVRRATLEDARAIYDLGITIPEINYSHVVDFMTFDELCGEVESHEAFVAVAEEAGRIVGFILVDYYDASGENWANITSLAVLPAYRRRGIFTTLFDLWKVDARARGITYVCAYACAGQPIVEFLKKRNFVPGKNYTFIDQKFEDIK